MSARVGPIAGRGGGRVGVGGGSSVEERIPV